MHWQTDFFDIERIVDVTINLILHNNYLHMKTRLIIERAPRR